MDEVTRCIAEFHFFAHPRQIEQLISLGMDEAEAKILTRAEADTEIEFRIAATAAQARGGYVEQIPRTIVF